MVYDKNGHQFTAILLNSAQKMIFLEEGNFTVSLVQFHAELHNIQA